VAAQVGVDFTFGDSWFLNGDIRWINIESKAKLSATIDGVDETVPLGTVKIDPFVYSIMIGYRF
jgi:outer membrane protein